MIYWLLNFVWDSQPQKLVWLDLQFHTWLWWRSRWSLGIWFLFSHPPVPGSVRQCIIRSTGVTVWIMNEVSIYELSECIQHMCWRLRLVSREVWLRMPYFYFGTFVFINMYFIDETTLHLGEHKCEALGLADTFLGMQVQLCYPPYMTHECYIWLTIPFLSLLCNWFLR